MYFNQIPTFAEVRSVLGCREILFRVRPRRSCRRCDSASSDGIARFPSMLFWPEYKLRFSASQCGQMHIAWRHRQPTAILNSKGKRDAHRPSWMNRRKHGRILSSLGVMAILGHS